ncbi:putative eukaryotic rRNA processing protein EBP2 [Lyophyllum shimeji]|uniref:Eukaryotic rRNA processing protein EBP2 n=1 Tax=Lyophyllum shimeji TaxID=47721 RepID=A0A9P3PLP6_LYOSH|nr:putative eukaryotic rRNA processing protein EBP2 [Lyophyllum shimeji]
MPSTTRAVNGSKKKESPTKPSKSPATARPEAKSLPKPAEPSSDDEEEDEEDDGDDEGVDEEGMARLMKALGDDGLDDFDRAQLNLMLGEGEEDESTDDEGDEGAEEAVSEADAELSGAGSEEEEEDSEEEDGEGEEEAEEAGEDSAEEGEEENEEKAEEAEEGEDEDEDQDVLLEDVDFVDEDAVPRQKIVVNDKFALERIRETIKLDPSFPWTETLVLSYPHTIDVDVNDDLNRELAFYKQALHGADAARAPAAKHKFPFTRPADYFAEMVKSDAHMERIRQRLLDESATIKKSEDKRKEREGKKFGKQVQLEKLKERERSKKDMEERLQGLKRKRKDMLDNPQAGDDDFDIAVEDAISDRPAKRGRSGEAGGGGRGGKSSRKARDAKFGFGGGNRRSKQNTRESTDNFDSRGRKSGGKGARGGHGVTRGGGRGGASKRPGKNRRIAARSKS